MFSMGEPPDWASLAEPLLRPKVAGHGLPADSPRGNTPLPQPQDTVEAMDSRSWKTHFRAAFEAYSEELLRQGWEPLRRSWWGDWWHIYPQGWNLDDFNAELVRHGCERYSSTSASSAQIYLLVELKCDRIDAAQCKMKERVDSGGSWTDTRTGKCAIPPPLLPPRPPAPDRSMRARWAAAVGWPARLEAS